MAHPNEDLVRRGFAAFGTGDIAALRELLADDTVWHVGGRSPLTGDYKGKDEVLGFFAQLAERAGGTFRVDVPTCWRTTSTWSPWSRGPRSARGRR
jgi:ketosteroid isomerase-like protein